MKTFLEANYRWVISLIFMAGIVYGTIKTTTQQVETNYGILRDHEKRIMDIEKQTAVLQEQYRIIQSSLDKIDNKLDRIKR